ncbi:hypothetical protein IIA29_09775 [candidate division KSB1 bacterium]|nr:hypothetical protein [candidate division KSB1 bacterium]
MASKLQHLLQDIDPAKTIDVVEQRINRVLGNYQRDKNSVDSWADYKACLAQFLQAARNAALRLSDDVGRDLEANFGSALHYLARAYPGNTLQTVYSMMQSGAEGGVYKIVTTLARLMAEEFAQNEINARISHYWLNLTVEEQLAAGDEYVALYQDLLPGNTREEMVRIKASFLRVLQDHPRMLKRMRELR